MNDTCCSCWRSLLRLLRLTKNRSKRWSGSRVQAIRKKVAPRRLWLLAWRRKSFTIFTSVRGVAVVGFGGRQAEPRKAGGRGQLSGRYPSGSATLEAAVKAHKAGDVESAERLYQQAISSGFSHQIAFSNLGVIYKNSGRPKQAIDCYRKALHIYPGFADAYANLANLLKEQGKLDQALEAALKAVELKPSLAETFMIMASIYKEQCQLDEALAATLKGIDLKPGFADAHLNLGGILKKQGHLDEALAATLKAIELKPGFADAYVNLGSILKEQGQLDEALAATLKGIELKPDFADAHLNLGGILNEQGQLDEALAATLKAIDLKPGSAEAHANLGYILSELGRYEEAELAHLKSLEIHPALSRATHNLSMCQLRKGDYESGWSNYTARWLVDASSLQSAIGRFPATSRPGWDGSKGCRVFVWAEQGLGDQIMYASILKEMQLCCEKVIVSADSRLLPLFKRSFAGNIEFVSEGVLPNEANYDYHLPMANLGMYFRKSAQDFGAFTGGYLMADQARVQSLRKGIKERDGRKVVGLSWHSNIPRFFNRSKSLPLELLANRLDSPDARLFSLQYGDVKQEIAGLYGMHGVRVEEIPDLDVTNDMDALAALVSACDEVVTISNVTAHMAGALGRPAHVLLAASAHWCWGVNSKSTIWYKSLRLYRQPRHGDWTGAIGDLQKHLS